MPITPAEALACARNFARFALCGMISGYNGESACPPNLLMAIEKRLLLQGFLVSDQLSCRAAFIKQMNEWLNRGEIIFRQTVELGIEQAPAAFLKLFSGEKMQDAREVVATAVGSVMIRRPVFTNASSIALP